jgi:hypothetical protein
MNSTQVKIGTRAARAVLRTTKLPPRILAAAKRSLHTQVRVGGRVQKLADGILTARAIEMRLQGAQWSEIADDLGIDEPQVFGLVEGALLRTRALVADNLDHLRDIESRRLDLYLAALAPACTAGNVAAINTALAVQARRARLLGLDLTPEAAAVHMEDNRVLIVTPDSLRQMAGEAMKTIGHRS